MDGNPKNLYADPEFQKLNPTVWQNASQPSGYEIPVVLSGDSDMTWETTSWIASNQPPRASWPASSTPGASTSTRTTWA